MVEVPLHQIVGVFPVQDRLVPAVRAVDVLGRVRAALMVRCAVILVRVVRLQLMLVHVVSMHMVQVSVMQVIGMPVVADRGVPAIGAMDVRVWLLFHASFSHDESFLVVSYNDPDVIMAPPTGKFNPPV